MVVFLTAYGMPVSRKRISFLFYFILSPSTAISRLLHIRNHLYIWNTLIHSHSLVPPVLTHSQAANAHTPMQY